jgi:hypothetical protein
MISLVFLAAGIVLTFSVIVFMMAIVLMGEGLVIKGLSCSIGLSEDCLRQDLQQERERLRQMQRRNQELLAENQQAEALKQRLAELDHAASSYVVFYSAKHRSHTVKTGHTYASLLNPDALIGAHCYVTARISGAGDRHIDLGKMASNKRVSLKTYRAEALEGTGLRPTDITMLQSKCRWPDGAS